MADIWSSYHLFLDDERVPGDVTWRLLPSAVYHIVRNYDEFVDSITNYGLPVFVTFDHDLADEHYGAITEYEHDDGDMKKTFSFTEKTGFDCAKFLVDYCIQHSLQFPVYEVHSMNPVGAERIRLYIEWAKRKVESLK